ncbi:hypothetical protein [Microvirga antarctica]|uniref:hypothetical protein n=1 Tax=Microvirga antarctica TaxID=2819233 RepID=UPI001B307EA2|nr:hypothetical protein [Microvirga antarctica]
METALAHMHGAGPEVQRGAFRGRLKHLQRLGLPLGDKPGKGKRIKYSEGQVWQLALALELAQCGVDPVTIVKMIQQCWDKIFLDAMREAAQSSKRSADRILILTVGMMSASWEPADESLAGLRTAGWQVGLGHVSFSLTGEKRRALMINIGDTLRQLNAQLTAPATKE